MSHSVTISEAARLLGVSRRTIQRRVKAGELPTADVAGRRYVVLSDTELSGELSQLPMGHDATRDEVGILRAQLEAVTNERDYLRQQLTQAVGALYALGEHKAISAPTQETTDAPRPAQRAWWRFWVRQG
jgi:excisionase family DNA binding protein